MSAIQAMSRPDISTRLLAGVSVPNTPLITRAIDYAHDHGFDGGAGGSDR